MPNLYGNFSAKTATITVVNVVDGSWTAVPTTALADRSVVEVNIKGENKVYFSFDSTAIVKDRFAFGGGETRTFPIQANVTLFARSQGGGTRIIVTEYR